MKEIDPARIFLFFFIIVIAISFVIAASMLNKKELNSFKLKKTGDRQYGSAEFIEEKDKRKYYQTIRFDPKSWRKGVNLPEVPKDLDTVGWIVGLSRNKKDAYIVRRDYNLLHIAPPGSGKTMKFCVENMEWQMANGISFVYTDTKGEYRKIAAIAEKYYGYKTAIYDFRNCIDSDKNNIMSLINNYIDQYKSTKDLRFKAIAERYAKINAKTIIGSTEKMGANTYFYDAAEALLASLQILVSEYAGEGKRHLVSVYTLLDEATNFDEDGSSAFTRLYEKLERTDNARLFASVSLKGSPETMASSVSTCLSKCKNFLDLELEQMSCFDTKVTSEDLAKGKTAIFIVIPEEDDTKYFYASIILDQIIGELFIVADRNGGKLEKEVRINGDEVGTMPMIRRLSQGLSAGRSRKMFFSIMLQGLYQLEEKYGKAADNMLDCLQVVIFGSMTPLSKTADALSNALGKQTIESGSTSHSFDSKNIIQTQSQYSYQNQMTGRELMFANEIKMLKPDEFVVYTKELQPTIMWLPWHSVWGIDLNDIKELDKKEIVEVKAATTKEIDKNIDLGKFYRSLNSNLKRRNSNKKIKTDSGLKAEDIEVDENGEVIQTELELPGYNVPINEVRSKING